MCPLGTLRMDLEDTTKGESIDSSLDIYDCLSALEKSFSLLEKRQAIREEVLQGQSFFGEQKI